MYRLVFFVEWLAALVLYSMWYITQVKPFSVSGFAARIQPGHRRPERERQWCAGRIKPCRKTAYDSLPINDLAGGARSMAEAGGKRPGCCNAKGKEMS
ncbi:hypothetical protein D3C87_1313480 [compost metagenome]